MKVAQTLNTTLALALFLKSARGRMKFPEWPGDFALLKDGSELWKLNDGSYVVKLPRKKGTGR